MSKVGNERGDETMGTMNIPRTIWEHYEEVDLNKLDNKKNGIHLCNKPTNRNPEEINPLKRSIRNKIKLWEKSPTKENLILSYSTKHLRTSYYWVFWKLLQILEKGYRGVGGRAAPSEYSKLKASRKGLLQRECNWWSVWRTGLWSSALKQESTSWWFLT